MDAKKYSQSAVEIINDANRIAIRFNNSEVTDLHLLYAILQANENFLAEFLKDSDVNFQKLKDDTENAIEKLKSLKGVSSLYVSRSYQKILIISEEIQRNLFEENIHPEHILLAILKDGDNQSAKLLGTHGISYDSFMQFLSRQFNESILKGVAKETLTTLEKYGRNLTKEALEGKLDPVIGREEETRSAIRILSRRIKNNPVLIGEAGVGKTAIVEGIVQRIVKGDVPDNLKERIVFALDMTSLVAGTKYRGDFEDRLKNILSIVRDSEGKIILFIDEIHNIMGAGNSSGTMDTANILKPMLARGEILTIGATTIEEYRKHIEKDGALDRRFQKILVEEPTIETSIAILRGIKAKYEKHHMITITDSALVDAVKLSKRFLSYRKLPDVAIDVIDEAAALARMTRDQVPVEIDNLNRALVQLEMERIALKGESDNLSKDRIADKEKEINELEETLAEKTKLYELERERQDDILLYEKELEEIENDIELAQNEHKIEKLNELIDSQTLVTNKLDKLKAIEPYYPVTTKVTTNEVKEIISKLSGMPKVKLTLNKVENLDDIREKMKDDFVGNDDMIDKIINTYLIAESGLFNKNKPIGSFLMAGPGTGKSYVAELVAKYLFDGESSLIRFDMGEFSEKSSVTKLIGAPPGYVGYEEGGVLTEAIRTKPYSVLVFTNIEKAHREIQSLISQIISEGTLKDNKGRSIDLKNTIVFLTTTLEDEAALEEKLAGMSNIVDYVFYLTGLDDKSTHKLIRNNLKKMAKDLEDSHVNLHYDEDFIDKFTAIAVENEMGVIDIIRFIEQEIYLEISKKLLETKTDAALELRLNLNNEELEVKVEN